LSPRALNRFHQERDERGVILVLFVVALTALVGLVAIAIGAGNLVQNNTNYENAADAAAFSAARAIRESASTATAAQDEQAATTAAENVANGYLPTGTQLGAGDDCTPPAGFAPAPSNTTGPSDNCVGYDQYNLEQTGVQTSSPAITMALYPSSDPFGTPIAPGAISAGLSGLSADATGTVAFSVVGPDPIMPASCSGGTQLGAPVGVTTASSYSPTVGFTPNQTGDYWWYADYSGDENDAPANTGCIGPMSVGSATPTLAMIVPDQATANSPIPDNEISALLSGASAPQPGDTITFTVFGPGSDPCISGGTQLGTPVAVSRNGTYYPNANPEFTPTQTGDFWWSASFSGDAANTPASTGCGVADEMMVEPGPALAISVLNYDTVNAQMTVTAILSGTSNVQSGDNITFVVFPQPTAPGDCTQGGQTLGAVDVTHGDGSYQLTGGFTPPSAGEYWWYAYFSGDPGATPNAPANSGCGVDETTVGQSVTTLTLSAPPTDTDGTLVTPAEIVATLSGSPGNPPTGDITFSVFGPETNAPSDCSSGGADVGLPVQLDNAPEYNPSSGFTPTKPGNYWWFATYSGDGNNLPTESGCGAVKTTVTLSSPTIAVNAPNTGTADVPILRTAIDASLAGTSGTSAGGSITFWVYGPGSQPTSCPGSTNWEEVGDPVPVSGDGSYSPDVEFKPTQVGDYWWYAVYGGDAGNSAANSACGAGTEETAVQASETLSMDAPSGLGLAPTTPIAPGSIAATLSGPAGLTPQGTITFWVYPPVSPGTEPTSCPGAGGAPGWVQVGTSAVNGYNSYNPTTGYIPLSVGEYWWYASYSGPNDRPVDSGCGIVVWVQIPAQSVPSLFGSGGGGTLSDSAFAFGSTSTDPSENKLCYYPGNCEDAPGTTSTTTTTS